MSQWVVLLIAMAAVCAVVVSVVVLRHRRISEDDDPSETPDVIEYMVMMIGVIYAIVLGLAIAGVWEGMGGAQADVLAETQALHEVKARVQVYPAGVRDKVRADVDAYAAFVADKEWSYMRDHGELSPRGTELLNQVRTDVTTFDPKSDLAAQAYQPVVDEVAAADTARASRGQNSRLDDAGGGVVRADRRGAGDGRADLHAADQAVGEGVAARRALQRADRLPAVPDLGPRRALRKRSRGLLRPLPPAAVSA